VVVNNDAEKLQAWLCSETGADHLKSKSCRRTQAARQSRDFAASDRIRKELAERGIILEDSRDGSVRWNANDHHSTSPSNFRLPKLV